MVIYYLSYYRYDIKDYRKNIKIIPLLGSQECEPKTMREAVEIILNRTREAGVKISKISCKIESSVGVQRFCDTCLKNEACYGFKGDTMKCYECYKNKETEYG